MSFINDYEPKRSFKKGLDRDICTDKRVEASLSLRKNKRRENLLKCRKQGDHFPTTNSPSTNNLNSSDPDKVLQCLISMRSSTYGQNKTTYTDVVIAKVISYITYTEYPEHQYNALWFMTNMISGDSTIAKKYLDNTPIIDYSLEILKSQNVKNRHQAIWLLGNAIGEGNVYTEYIVNKGTIPLVFNELLYDLQEAKRVTGYIETCTWVLSGLFRHKIDIDVEIYKKAMEITRYFFKECSDRESVRNMYWMLARISGKLSNQDIGMVFQCFNKLNLENFRYQICTLRICGNLIASTHENTQKVIDMGLLNYFPVFLKKKQHTREICWIISNIASGTKEQINTLVKMGLIPLVMLTATESNWKTVKECIYVVCNVIYNSPEQHSYLVNIGAIRFLAKYLHIPQIEMTEIILKNLLLLVPKYKYRIEEHCYGGVEKLTDSHNTRIYQLASELLDNLC